MEQLLLLFALTRHLIAAQTGASELAPFEQAPILNLTLTLTLTLALTRARFVLFSNGILMYFSDPNRAVLGQALGFIPVDSCTESSHSAKQHTLLVKCPFDP